MDGKGPGARSGAAYSEGGGRGSGEHPRREWFAGTPHNPSGRSQTRGDHVGEACGRKIEVDQVQDVVWGVQGCWIKTLVGPSCHARGTRRVAVVPLVSIAGARVVCTCREGMSEEFRESDSVAFFVICTSV